MRKLVINIAAFGAILAGLWVAGMVGNPEIDGSVAAFGSILAIALGVFAAAGIGLIWGDLAEDLDFKDWLRRIRGKSKDR